MWRIGTPRPRRATASSPALVGVRFTEHPATIPCDTLGESQNFHIALFLTFSFFEL